MYCKFTLAYKETIGIEAVWEEGKRFLSTTNYSCRGFDQVCRTNFSTYSKKVIFHGLFI